MSNYNAEDKLVFTGKVARAEHNAERHKALNGKTVGEALGGKNYTKADLNYDLKVGFLSIEPSAKAKKVA
tara:strand:- start:85 stop:294 length:210 start_codon:yes stop_codon:yes gene_type:complete